MVVLGNIRRCRILWSFGLVNRGVTQPSPLQQPSVHFTYSNASLRVDCNEVGFSPRNVEALCRVGQSTKKGGDNATQYVGGKGIGFKSVFKAADVVWISSGPYSFKFDKSKQLGMIAPISTSQPQPNRDLRHCIFSSLRTTTSVVFLMNSVHWIHDFSSSSEG
jgi:hypothetical protein